MSTFPGKPVRFASMLLALTALVTSPGYAQQPAATQDVNRLWLLCPHVVLRVVLEAMRQEILAGKLF